MRMQHLMLYAFGLLIGCSAQPALTERPSTAVAEQPSPSVTEAPSGAPSAPPHEIVGVWRAEHRCEQIVALLEESGREAFITETIEGNGLVGEIEDLDDPCAGAVPREHSHEFAANYNFASFDWNGNQVDEGGWHVVDSDTISINGVEFTYAIEGDRLSLESDEGGVWPLMVALPGTEWERVED